MYSLNQGIFPSLLFDLPIFGHYLGILTLLNAIFLSGYTLPVIMLILCLLKPCQGLRVSPTLPSVSLKARHMLYGAAAARELTHTPAAPASGVLPTLPHLLMVLWQGHSDAPQLLSVSQARSWRGSRLCRAFPYFPFWFFPLGFIYAGSV